MNCRVSEKGQVTIPKSLRDRLGIRAGQVLEFREDSGRLIVTKHHGMDPFEQVTGILSLHKATDALIDELRGKADAL